MKFTVERAALIRIIRNVSGAPLPGTAGKCFLVLGASGPWVIVGLDDIAAGTEALVLAEGECVVHRASLLRILQTYRGAAHLTFEADERSLRFASTTLPISGFTRRTTAPSAFAVCKSSAAWLASLEALREESRADGTRPRR